jgi:hypothetical protein
MINQLTQFELALLPRALALIQTNPEVSRDSLRRELACGADIAMRLLTHLRENDQVKIAERLQALPAAAEVRAETQFILGDTSGSSYSYVLRENARLQKALAKAKHKTEAEKEQRATEIRQEIEELKALAKEQIQRKPQAVKPRKDTDLMLEISTPDLHAGKLCWPLETGGAPYDVAIAIATFERAIEVLLERTKNFEFSEVLFCIGNDALNSDNPEGTTTSGTSVSNDGRFFRTFSRVRTMLVHTVERLLKIAPVRIVCCPGNHDSNSAYFLADSLECYFNADSRVVVENEPISRKYVRFGKCLIGFCHGHEERKEDLALLMASERPQDWSETLFREWHTGHYHKIQNQEFHGVRVRIIGALCSQDDWHSQKGYVNNLRTAQAFVWSKTEGLISEVFYNADAEEPITTRTEIV